MWRLDEKSSLRGTPPYYMVAWAEKKNEQIIQTFMQMYIFFLYTKLYMNQIYKHSIISLIEYIRTWLNLRNNNLLISIVDKHLHQTCSNILKYVGICMDAH